MAIVSKLQFNRRSSDACAKILSGKGSRFFGLYFVCNTADKEAKLQPSLKTMHVWLSHGSLLVGKHFGPSTLRQYQLLFIQAAPLVSKSTHPQWTLLTDDGSLCHTVTTQVTPDRKPEQQVQFGTNLSSTQSSVGCVGCLVHWMLLPAEKGMQDQADLLLMKNNNSCPGLT